jgi:hypothetical protein
MNIKPVDILYMLEDEDLASMEYSDLYRLCNVITLDIQLEKERYKEPETFLA